MMISHSTLMVDCSRRNTRIYSPTQVYNLNFEDKIVIVIGIKYKKEARILNNLYIMNT